MNECTIKPAVCAKHKEVGTSIHGRCNECGTVVVYSETLQRRENGRSEFR